jgi:hypothetical protein
VAAPPTAIRPTPTAVSEPVGAPVTASGWSLRDGLGAGVTVAEIGEDDADGCGADVEDDGVVTGELGGAEVGGAGGEDVGRAATSTVTVALSVPNFVLTT